MFTCIRFTRQRLDTVRQYVSALIITLTCIYIIEMARYMDRPVFNSLMFLNMAATWLALIDNDFHILNHPYDSHLSTSLLPSVDKSF